MQSPAHTDLSQSPKALQIGDVAPDFDARTTMGVRRLSDYRGRWLLLFSHPADFTPVCTSEFIALSRAADRFEALGCDLLGVSVDSLYSHLAWIQQIRAHFGVTVAFPIVEDSSMVIGRAYGMIAEAAENSAAMRATYFLDPDGIVRAILNYPATIGRSVEELLRVLVALQTTDAEGVVTPEGWRPGDDVLLPPEEDQTGALRSQDPCWFYRTRPRREEAP